MMRQYNQVTVSPTTDKSLPAFDFTKLTALNTCPRWGLIRYDQHKRMPGAGRTIPLELGSAAHDSFAAIRLFELYEFGRAVYGEAFNQEAIKRRGLQLFGAERYDKILDFCNSTEDTRRKAIAVAMYAANSSGFYDDPDDARRTISNLESSLIAYVDRAELGRRLPLIRGDFVGIEVPFDVTINYATGDWPETKLRYIGKVDAVCLVDGTNVEIDENKTASRLDRTWQDGFMMSHQVTGYMIALSCVLGQPVREGQVRGMMVPLPKSYDLGGICNLPVDRDEYRFNEWYRWVYDTYINQYLPFRDDPLSAPEYTHSCNRYFRTCSFLPLCAMADPESRRLNYEQMEVDEWNPLAEGDS